MIVKITKYVSAGSLTAAVIYALSSVLFYFYTQYDIYSVIFSILLFLAIVIRHISNIKRLLRGEENKIGVKTE